MMLAFLVVWALGGAVHLGILDIGFVFFHAGLVKLNYAFVWFCLLPVIFFQATCFLGFCFFMLWRWTCIRLPVQCHRFASVALSSMCVCKVYTCRLSALCMCLGCWCAMSRVWADPRCPLLGPDGSPPSWLVLRAYDGESRQWYCALCERWAEGSHLNGQRHLDNLWYFNDRCPGAALTSSVAACSAQACHSSGAILSLATEPATPDLLVGGASDCAPSQFSEDGRAHAHRCRITSLAQIDPRVVEELFACLLAYLQLDSSG